MCLTIKTGCKIEIAQNDIKVYKLIDKRHDYWKPIYCQRYRRFEYCKPITAFDLYTIPIKTLKICHYRFKYEIYEGFHSRVKHYYFTNTICIIPKGSEICYGSNNDIVSTQLIVFKNYFQYLIYKLKKHFNHE